MHIAIGVFQGDADWSVSVRVGGFSSKKEAERYADSFHIQLMDGHLYRDQADGKERAEVSDEDVSLSRLTPSARNRISRAHRKYSEQGFDRGAIASHSIKDFEATGRNDLVTSDDDYETVNLPIAQWHQEIGLTSRFGSLSYRTEVNHV